MQACFKQKLTVITRNIRNNLYKALSQTEMQGIIASKEARSLLNKREISTYDDAVNKEKNFALTRTKVYFRERLDKIKNAKNKSKRETEAEIDGIIMKDIKLGGQFESKPQICEGIAIGRYESQALSLPSKFAISSKVKPIECKEEVEKALRKLRWKREFERLRGVNQVKRDVDDNTIYNSDEKTWI